MWLSDLVYGPSIIVFTVSAETTPHVYQASGYGDLTANKSIWFVFYFGVSLRNFYQCDNVPPTGSGFLPHAITLTRLPSSRGLMVVYVILSVNRSCNTQGITLAWKFEHDRLVSGAWSLPYQQSEHWSWFKSDVLD